MRRIDEKIFWGKMSADETELAMAERNKLGGIFMAANSNLSQYLGQEMHCACGRTHSTKLKIIDVEEGALKRLPEHIKELGYKNVFMVCDVNTWEAAGKTAEQELTDAGIRYYTLVFPEKELVPDEQAVGKMMEAYEKGTDLILAVGSGTLNDLCKFMSSQVELPYMILATAPSMDGFVSVGAALIHNHVKTTYQAHVPEAVMGDPEILAAAPMEMIVAGLGDILGKYTCLVDWKMAHLIEGEYYCETINNMVKESIEIVVEESDGVRRRDQEAVKHLMEALVLSGVAMSFIGNSRPASGSEHHLSHYWEMQFQMEDKKPVLHGIKVGVGMLAVIKMYEMLKEEQPDFAAAAKRQPDYESWKKKVCDCYKDAAPGILELEEQRQKNSVENRNKRLAVMKEKWPEIQALFEREIPSGKKLKEMMESLGEPVNPEQIGISPELVRDAIILAKEVRNRFTILQVLWDLGLLEEYAQKVTEYFAEK